MQPRLNVWLEQDGNVVLSLWRVQLLETIAATGSISAAAKQLDIPYRRAWEKVQEIERGLGTPVLVTAVGGAGGGGAQLTAAARQAIAQFYTLIDGLEQEIQARYAAAFQATDQPM
ncbi:MAG: LysR family transcriptional regulator [Caldilineaceae bacterium]